MIWWYGEKYDNVRTNMKMWEKYDDVGNQLFCMQGLASACHTLFHPLSPICQLSNKSNINCQANPANIVKQIPLSNIKQIRHKLSNKSNINCQINPAKIVKQILLSNVKQIQQKLSNKSFCEQFQHKLSNKSICQPANKSNKIVKQVHLSNVKKITY